MFAQRFDPDAPAVEQAAKKLLPRKRKLEERTLLVKSRAKTVQSETLSLDLSLSLSLSLESLGDSLDGLSDSLSEDDSLNALGNLSDLSLSDLTDGESEAEMDTRLPETPLEHEAASAPEKEPDTTEPAPADPEAEAVEHSVDRSHLAKHASILQKFNLAKQNEEEPEEEEQEDREVHDLGPIPQPALPSDQNLESNKAHQQNLDWLAEPEYSSPEDKKPLSDFPLLPKVLENLQALGFSSAFSVQIAVWNHLLLDVKKNRLAPDFQGDLLVNASTGSGKTLAYAVPIIEALQARIVPRVRAIILVPTKPLILQVTSTLRGLSAGVDLWAMGLSGELSVKEERARLLRCPDIIVSTPGRLVEHLGSGAISLEALRFLVVDEADRLLNQLFQNWCEVLVLSIERWHPRENTAKAWSLQPQKLVFSATLTTDAGKLSLLKFRKPRLVIVNLSRQLVNEMFSVPSGLREWKMSFSLDESALKPLLLAKFLLQAKKTSHVLIFAKSNDATLRLCQILNDLFVAMHLQINVAYINSTNNVTSTRNRLLSQFHEGKINLLIATDLIARGMDLLSISSVINYDLPTTSREYVHRVGRTARANQTGDAYTLIFGPGENRWFSSLMTDVSRPSPILDVDVAPVLEEEQLHYDEVMEKFLQAMRSQHLH